jgi:hypothetical protein
MARASQRVGSSRSTGGATGTAEAVFVGTSSVETVSVEDGKEAGVYAALRRSNDASCDWVVSWAQVALAEEADGFG